MAFPREEEVDGPLPLTLRLPPEGRAPTSESSGRTSSLTAACKSLASCWHSASSRARRTDASSSSVGGLFVPGVVP